MISKENSQPVEGYKKHANLVRPGFGNFNRNEWAVIGGQCSAIKQLAGQVIKALSSRYKCAYVDATHIEGLTELPGLLSAGAVLEYTDQINCRQLSHSSGLNQFKLRDTFAMADVVLVNGNHHQAKAQVVIIDNYKKASLQKRISQLTNVQMLLLANGTDGIFDFIKETLPNWYQLPVYRLDETEKIITFFDNQMQLSKPVLNGLVLAGGKSQRMGFDKGAVNWHGRPQRYHMAGLLKNFCEEVFISCRADQRQEIDIAYPSLPDTFTGLGPFGAILSAFREKPDSAWLVVACDLPLLDEQTLRYLTHNRDSSAIATAFQSSFMDFPEPLITIWEPKSYPVLLSFLAQGYSCPRKVLINSDINFLQAPNPAALTNVNTPEDFQSTKELLSQKTFTA